ncbi:MAG: J domain-containing protein [Bdellovibrionales bacterium]|nr:J domain-containing protein [Bdellovibrionales bacterium]
MRPFSTLGVRPFLRSDARAQTELLAEFHRRSRQLHPDRFINAADSVRAEAEAKSAELNSDYSILKDTWRLIDHVLRAAPGEASAQASKGAPPELAADYFELQESWADNGPEASRAAAQEFLAKVATLLKAAEADTLALASQFPYGGAGDSDTAPWTQSDLEKIRSSVHKVRYFRSFEADIRRKFNVGN